MTQLANALATKPGDSSFIQGFHTMTEAWVPHTQISEYHKKIGGLIQGIICHLQVHPAWQTIDLDSEPINVKTFFKNLKHCFYLV